ncbi:MAG: glycosyltransferase family 4 protein [Candidatus Aminicenantes bacterium]|nr:glycosyltransferase family 4 protein [Candidatus Aminicenantes bacterium]
MKVAFVVQRYGLEINGGAELHCRWVCEHMQKYWDIQVLTTRAFDYITWKDHYGKGDDVVNGIPVKRFSVTKPRNPDKFGRIQSYILDNEHREEDELKWLDEEGPLSPSLIRYIDENRDEYDYFIFFSYRYYHSYWGIRTVPEKSVLVPTAEHDPVVHLQIFKNLFRKPQAFIYNSHEERNMINLLSKNDNIPGDVVGVGSEIPERVYPEEFRKKHGLEGDYIIYIGRIDENKGCHKLFDYFLQYKRDTDSDIKLVLVGSNLLKIPSHPDIRYLGFLSEEDKFSALAGARVLAMPSFYESLSMVTLEAWALEKPVLANARCEVLKGQCLRSNAGLFYEDYEEFRECLQLLLDSKELRTGLGRNGKSYYIQNYTWEVIENKYIATLDRLKKRK